jgi:hypothetical protein
MDFTPVSLYKIPKINRKTSSAFELATSVIFLSGIQHFVEGPAGMAEMPAPVKKFMQDIPAAWDEVKFIDGYPGKFYVVARRCGKKWYIAGINADSVQTQIPLNLSFLAPLKSGVMFYNNNGAIATSHYPINAIQNKTVTLQPNDGFIIVIE